MPPTSPSRRFTYTVPKFPARNSYERSHPAIVALYTSTPRFSLARPPHPLPSLPPSPPSPPPALSPPRRSPSAILPLVALPRPSLSPSISVGFRCSPWIRSRRKCTPASATRSGFSFHAQWQSPFDVDSRLTRLIRSPYYVPFLPLQRSSRATSLSSHLRRRQTGRVRREKIITYKFYASEVDAFERPCVSLASPLFSFLFFLFIICAYYCRARSKQRIVRHWYNAQMQNDELSSPMIVFDHGINGLFFFFFFTNHEYVEAPRMLVVTAARAF